MSLLRSNSKNDFPEGDPEWKLLCRLVVDYAEQRNTVVDEQIDWQRLLALGDRHRVQPLLATQLLRKDNKVCLSGSVRDALIRGKQKNLEHILHVAAELKRLGKLLDQAGVEYRVLKGLPLAAYAYHQVVDRHAGDIDILLLDQAAIFKVHQQLQEHNYGVNCAHTQYGDNLQSLYFRIRKDNVYITPDHGLKLEIHWPSETIPAFPKTLLGCYAATKAQSIDCLGRSYLFPQHDVICDYLVWHGARTQWFRLKWLVDIYLLLEKDDAVLSDVKTHVMGGVSWQLVMVLLERMFDYKASVLHSAPPALQENICLQKLRGNSRPLVLTSLLAYLMLTSDWRWRRYVMRRTLIHLPDYRKVSPPIWVVYLTLPIVRPLCRLYRGLRGGPRRA